MSRLTSRSVLAGAPLLVLLAAAAIFAIAVFKGAPKRPSALIGRPAPPLTLAALPGGDIPVLASADLAGRTTLVNFWASWCAPCRVEHPALMALSLREGLNLVGIAWKDEPDKARAYLERLGNPFVRAGLDGDGRTGIDWGLSGVPESFLIGPDGRVLAHQEGPLTDEALRRFGLAPK